MSVIAEPAAYTPPVGFVVNAGAVADGDPEPPPPPEYVPIGMPGMMMAYSVVPMVTSNKLKDLSWSLDVQDSNRGEKE